MWNKKGHLLNHFQLCTFDMAPFSDERVNFFQKVGPENASADRVNVKIFRNFIIMFYWTKRTLTKK